VGDVGKEATVPFGRPVSEKKNSKFSATLSVLVQGQLQEWTEHSHTDLPKSETSRDIKKNITTYISKLKWAWQV
jgi:hypothetical protein